MQDNIGIALVLNYIPQAKSIVFVNTHLTWDPEFKVFRSVLLSGEPYPVSGRQADANHHADARNTRIHGVAQSQVGGRVVVVIDGCFMLSLSNRHRHHQTSRLTSPQDVHAAARIGRLQQPT